MYTSSDFQAITIFQIGQQTVGAAANSVPVSGIALPWTQESSVLHVSSVSNFKDLCFPNTWICEIFSYHITKLLT